MLKLLFPMGQIIITEGIARRFPTGAIARMLGLHSMGIWGDLDEEDIETNNKAMRTGGRLLSAYHLDGLPKAWVITECDRSATTILLPEEY